MRCIMNCLCLQQTEAIRQHANKLTNRLFDETGVNCVKGAGEQATRRKRVSTQRDYYTERRITPERCVGYTVTVCAYNRPKLLGNMQLNLQSSV